MKQNIMPIFRNARTVSYSLKEITDKELHKLEYNGIITKIQQSE